MSSRPSRDLVVALEAVARNRPFLSPKVTRSHSKRHTEDSRREPSTHLLTNRETEVLRLIADGKSNQGALEAYRRGLERFKYFGNERRGASRVPSAIGAIQR